MVIYIIKNFLNCVILEWETNMMYFNISKFPSTLKKGFTEDGINFPSNIEFEYEEILAYRKITRDDFKDCTITKNDFKSYAELNKPKPRGMRYPSSYYSCSLNTSLDVIRTMFKFPGKTKGIAVGYIKKVHGPKLGPNSDSHVDWWLYENAEPEKEFNFLEGGIEHV